MKNILTLSILIFLYNISTAQTSTDIKYIRASYNDDPATTISIGWTGVDAVIYYGTTDFGTNYTLYSQNKSVTKTTTIYNLTNKFIDLKNLTPKTTYYFVLRESNGKLSQRYSFRTLSDNPNDPITFVSGGDTRDGIVIENCNCRGERQKSFTLLGKICIDFIAFSGDFVGGPQQNLFKPFKQQWEEWFTDWQLTLNPANNRLIPIIPAMGNHEESSNNLSFFNIPTTTNYFGITFGGNLLRLISLNTELPNNSTQISWFQNDLINNQNVLWKGVQYHKPMVPQGHYSPEPLLINNWAGLFSQYGVRIAMEGHTHIYKVTFPAIKSGGAGNNYFIRDNANGAVFLGEGNMGAPYRTTLYSKFAYTREVGKSFTSFFHVRVSKDTMKVITVMVNSTNESKPYATCASQGQQLDATYDIYDAADGATNDPVVLIPRFGFSDFSYVVTSIKQNTTAYEVAKLYPNPADDVITLSLTKQIQDAEIEMYDAMGRHIQSLYQVEDDPNISIDLAYIPSGAYYIYIKTSEGIQTLKFLKK